MNMITTFSAWTCFLLVSFKGMLGPGHGRFQQKTLNFTNGLCPKRWILQDGHLEEKMIINLEILGHTSFKHVPSLSVGEQIACLKGHD